MELDPNEVDPNDVIDRRVSGGVGGLGGMLGGPGLPMGRAAGMGGVGAVVVIVVLVAQSCLSGGSGLDLRSTGGLDQIPSTPSGAGQMRDGRASDLAVEEVTTDASQVELQQLANAVISDANHTWADQFAAAGLDYGRTKLVLFTGGVRSECGDASSDVGPFYCPADAFVYIDLTFFVDLADRFDAPGDFAQAYVIAHEVGHHVQNELGVTAESTRLERQDPGQANAISVRVELQADCLAGVWAHSVYAEGRLEPGDIREALGAASAVGDDRIQRAAADRVDPDSFTHGSAAQRARWFERGFERGDADRCDTFAVEDV